MTEAITVRLTFPPLLASWEAATHPSQQRLKEYRTAVAELAAPALDSLAPPLALSFYVAGRADVRAGCDLDNFLTPVIAALGGGDRFFSVQAIRGQPDQQSVVELLSAANEGFRLEGARAAWQCGLPAHTKRWPGRKPSGRPSGSTPAPPVTDR